MEPWSPGSASLIGGQVVPAGHRLTKVADEERHVDLRGPKAGVAGHGLHVAEVGAALEDVGEGGVAQSVGGLGDTGGAHERADQFRHEPGGDRLVRAPIPLGP